MKVLVAFSGGKDSLASLLWAKSYPSFRNCSIEAVFCDTGWEYEGTYKYIKDVCSQLRVPLKILRSSKYAGFIDLVKKKLRFPSTKARFCTQELKTKAMIDYILKQEENLIIVQGIRAEESKSRAAMEKQCTYFKYYFQPYSINKKGIKQFHNYRKKEVIQWTKMYADDVLRPVFNWSADEVIHYCVQNGYKLNPLYYMGFARVGCFPCIMCQHYEVMTMMEKFPDRLKELAKLEKELGTTFFPPGYIPDRFCSQSTVNKKGKLVYYPAVPDVVKYIKIKKLNNEPIVFDEGKSAKQSCMSYYSICHS